MYKQRVFYKEINLNDEESREEYNQYQDLLHSQTPIEVDGFFFLITSLKIDGDKFTVNGFQCAPPTTEK